MSKSIFLLSFWPGLPGLIRHGRGVFLTISLGFGWIATMTLFCCGFWTELLSAESKIWLGAGVIVCWIVLTLTSAGLSRIFNRQLAYDEEGDRFLLAMNCYLAGDWTNAEKIARAILKRNKRDPEILLFLATLYRHTDRPDKATEILDRLERLESAEKWSYEIAIERQALAESPEPFQEGEEPDEKNSDEAEMSNSILPFPQYDETASISSMVATGRS